MSSAPLLKSIVPPFLWSIGSHFKRQFVRSTTLLQYAPQGWSTPLPDSINGDAFWTSSLSQEQEHCEALVARIRANDPMLYADGDVNSKYAIFAYVLALATRNRQRLSVLDYGGNLGDYYWLGRAMVPGVDLDYHCKELPRVAETGRRVTPCVTWHTDDTCLESAHDLVMFSSAIQCLPNWEDILLRAGRSARRYLLLLDVATVRNVKAYVATHRASGRTHLQVQLNRAEVIATAESAGLRLVREFPMGSHPPIINAPEQPTCIGWLFERP